GRRRRRRCRSCWPRSRRWRRGSCPWGGGELLGHPGVVERDVPEGLGAAVLEAEGEGVAGVELEVLDGFGADEDRVGPGGELAEELSGGPAGEVGVLDAGGGPHAVEVLEVGADVGEAVLDGFDRGDAGDPGQRRGGRWADGGPG